MENRFNELEMIKTLKQIAKDTFRGNEWNKLFGNKRVTISDDLEQDNPSFPFIHIDLYNNLVDEESYSSTQRHQYTRFYFDITIYTEEIPLKTETISAKTLNIKMKEELKSVLIDYGFTITSDQQVQNIDRAIYRRLLKCEAIIDNKTKIIYKV